MITAQLLFLEAEDPKKEIHMYINSPGRAGDGGHGDLRHHAVCAAPRADLLHRPGGFGGVAAALRGQEGGADAACPMPGLWSTGPGQLYGLATDIARHAQEIVKLKRRLNEIYAELQGQTVEAIEKMLDRDTYMTAEEARD